MKNTKILGTATLVGAPFLLVGPQMGHVYKPLAEPWFYGIWAVIYVTAWMCSIEGLRRMEATGKSRFGKGILWAITGTLMLANLSNLYASIVPGYKSTLFIFLDAFWPISNLIMLVVGITVVAAKGLPGWRRYVTLVVGLWFPLTVLVMTGAGRNSLLLGFVPYYSVIAWALLAAVTLTGKAPHPALETQNSGPGKHWQ